MREDRSVTFSLSASSVNALDGTAITLFTFPNDGVVRVPDRLEIKRLAGTAYTVTKGVLPYKKRIDEDFDSYSTGFQGGNSLQFYEGRDDSSSPRMWFRVGAEGFLDVATEQARVVFPLNSGKEFKSGVTGILVKYNGQGLASGTGSVQGTLYYREYRITLPIGL